MSKIRVLHIIASPSIGGAEKLLLILLKNYDRSRFELILGSYYRAGEEDLFFEAAKEFDIPAEAIEIGNAYGVKQLYGINQIVKKHRPHIIHTHGYKTNICGFLVAKLWGIPIVGTVHGWYHVRKKKTRLLNRLSLLILRYFNLIIAVSGEIKERLILQNIDPRKIMVLRNVPSVNKEAGWRASACLHSPGKANQSKVIGFVGRLEKVKGCEQFLRAASEAVKKDPTLRFMVVGDGSEKTRIESLALELGLQNRVKFLGFCIDPTPLFNLFDLYVLPSLDEGIPLTVLEAMALGVPVIATHVGGVPEVIQDGINGMLVPPGDPNALAQAIERALSTPAELDKWVREGRRLIEEKYNIDQWVSEILNIYSKILERNKLP